MLDLCASEGGGRVGVDVALEIVSPNTADPLSPGL